MGHVFVPRFVGRADTLEQIEACLSGRGGKGRKGCLCGRHGPRVTSSVPQGAVLPMTASVAEVDHVKPIASGRVVT